MLQTTESMTSSSFKGVHLKVKLRSDVVTGLVVSLKISVRLLHCINIK